MKTSLVLLACLAASCFGADVRYTDLNLNQINTNGYRFNIASGVTLTNIFSSGTFTHIGNPTGLSFAVNTNQLVVTNGNVGIFTNTPSAKLEVNGTAKIDGLLTGGANFDINGRFRLLATNSYITVAPVPTGQTILAMNGSGANFGGIQVESGGTSKWSLAYTASGDYTLGTPVLTWTEQSRVGVGTNAPASRMHLNDQTNTTSLTITHDGPQANVTASDVFIDFRSGAGSEGSVAGTAVAGVLAYNTFTGSHYTEVVGTNVFPVGTLLEIIPGIPSWGIKTNISTNTICTVTTNVNLTLSTNCVDNVVTNRFIASPKSQLFRTRVCSTLGSKAAIGVYGGTDKEGRDMVLAMGTGIIIVANKGTNITIGDYLIASDVPGCVQVQSDNIHRNNTVAKATENWTFTGENRKMIRCVYVGD